MYRDFAKCAFAGALVAALSCWSFGVDAKAGFKVLYSFTGGSDGGNPIGGLVRDKSGNLFGTTFNGGANSQGAAFSLAPDGTMTTLYSFKGGSSDGSEPLGTLLLDKQGYLYGTTQIGGPGDFGTVFFLSNEGFERVLYAFNDTDGANPFSGVIADKAGNLYGGTAGGGINGLGVIFKLSPAGTETVLHAFPGSGDDGGGITGNLIRDKKGDLYGATDAFGPNGDGTVFKLSADGTLTTLHSFSGDADGGDIEGGLIRDKDGNFYGTTFGGGLTNCHNGAGCGVVFKLARNGTETTLYRFTGGDDGGRPQSGLLRDEDGTLYGTTTYDGNQACSSGCGAVFKLAPDGTETTLHTFTGGADGSRPFAGLITDRNKGFRHLYGVAANGGVNNSGVVFQIKLKP